MAKRAGDFGRSMKSDTKHYSCLQILAFLFSQIILWINGNVSGTLLEPPSSIIACNTSSSSIIVTWAWDSILPSDNSNYNIAGYKVSYREHGLAQEGNNFLCSPVNNSTELTNLKIFTNYCIEIATFTNENVSNRSQCLFTTTEEEVPTAPPQNFSVFNTSSTSLQVTWDPLPLEHRRGIILGYKIFYEKYTHSQRVSRSIEIGEQSIEASSVGSDIVGLEKFANYCVWGVAFNRMGRGNETKTACISTDEDVPSHPPLNVSAYNTSTTSISVRWDAIPTEFIPGILLGYKVLYSKANEPSMQYSHVILGTDQFNVDLLSLEEFTEYCIQLAGFTRIGDGNRSECVYVTTEESIVIRVPQPIVENSYSPTAVKVTWELPPDTQGIISGYKLHIIETGSSTEPSEALFEEFIMIQNASQTSLIISNLSIFTTYWIRMAAYNYEKMGNFSDPVIAETCHCPKYLSTFVSPSPLDKGGSGGMTELISNIIKITCGVCKVHGETELAFSNNDDGESSVRFPSTVTSPRGSDFSKFVAILEVPGVVVIKRRGDTSTQRYYEQVMTGSLLDTWPIVTFSLLAVYAAGVIVWLLDRKENPDEFPGNFIRGAYEGFWWSFMTMTTVGYGDRCPKSNLAKAFAIVWLLFSLVLMSFLMGAISSVLTVTVMQTRTTVPPKIGGNKAAAITNSAEERLAMGPISSKLKLTTTYSTVEALVRSLKEGEVDYVLVDMYLPVTRKDLFNGSWFEIAALLEVEMYHGVILQGDALKLAVAIEDMIRHENVQTEFLGNYEDDEAPSQVESKQSLFFDPTSPFSQHILFASLGVLCFFLVCGSLYQVVYLKQRKRSERVWKAELEKSRRELKCLVDEFYHSLHQLWRKMKKKHKQELLELGRKKREHNRKGSNTSKVMKIFRAWFTLRQ